MRKMADGTKSGSPKKSTRGRKLRLAQTSRPRRSRRRVDAAAPALPGVRPPLPGSGKRGENGHIAYLLRQAQAAARLTLERALADLGVTPPQFAVLTMLNAYPGLSGADVARVALLTPQTVGVIIGNLERDGAVRKLRTPCTAGCCNGHLRPAGRTSSTSAAAVSASWNGAWSQGWEQGRKPPSGAGCPKLP